MVQTKTERISELKYHWFKNENVQILKATSRSIAHIETWAERRTEAGSCYGVCTMEMKLKQNNVLFPVLCAGWSETISLTQNGICFTVLFQLFKLMLRQV